MAGELAAEWIKIPDGNGNLQKVWVRDSTARRDIAQLQTDVSGLVIPDPSDASPQMDGTAAAGSSADYSRADHVHPSDTSKQDALTTAQLNAVNSGVTADFVTKKFATVTGTFASSTTYTALQSYPDGFTQTNCIVLALEAQRNGLWRGGGNTYGTSQQTFVQLEANGYTVFNSQSAGFSQPFRVTFMRTDI